MKTFEELPIYQKSKELCLVLYRLNNQKYSKDYGFKDQLQRASISVLNNIAEGFERGSDKDFIFTWKTTVYDGGNVLSAKPVKYKLEYEQI